MDRAALISVHAPAQLLLLLLLLLLPCSSSVLPAT